MQKTGSTILSQPVLPNLGDYENLVHSFDWQQEKNRLSGLPGDRGLNMAYEAVERHASGNLKDTPALIWIRKDQTAATYTYRDLDKLSSRFANVLTSLGVKKGDRVFALAGRVPELYITA